MPTRPRHWMYSVHSKHLYYHKFSVSTAKIYEAVCFLQFYQLKFSTKF